jgi:outer membrane lipoprotein-sorting protein
MVTIFSYLITVISFVVLSSTSSIEKVQTKFNNLNNFQSDFTQMANDKIGLKGKFYFSKENNYRIELQNNIIIADGMTIWNYDKKRNRVIVSNIEDDPLAFSLREYIFNYPAKCDITEEKVNSDKIVITLKPKSTELNFKEAKLFLTNDYLVNKIEVKDFNGSSFAFIFDNIKIDKNISTNLFQFTNNTDAKIIDLR